MYLIPRNKKITIAPPEIHDGKSDKKRPIKILLGCAQPYSENYSFDLVEKHNHHYELTI